MVKIIGHAISKYVRRVSQKIQPGLKNMEINIDLKRKEILYVEIGMKNRELQAIYREFPVISQIIRPLEQDLGTQKQTAFELIGHMHPAAKEAALRSALVKIGGDDAFRAIAESDIREGIPYSSAVRLFPDLFSAASDDVRAHEEAYGAPVFSRSWRSMSRGAALRYYFSQNPPSSGHVLHVAPEIELENWFKDTNHVARYQTLSMGLNTDLIGDLTALDIADDSVDIVICHRVLEHIFDEPAALSEIHRILRPGGMLNISVPESMNLPQTLDWHFPDLSRHQHYQQYGSDFAARLTAAGFDVEIGDWLLKQSYSSLDDAQVYSMRFYNAYA